MKTRSLIWVVLFGCFYCQQCKPCKKVESPFKWEYKGSAWKKEPDIIHAFERYFSNRRYNQLSKTFNFEVVMDEFQDSTMCYNCRITVKIFDKSDSLLQTIKTNASSCAYPVNYEEATHVRSYETHYNEKRKTADGYYHGELIVGDFNFDGLVDLAIIQGIPMSGTPWYRFYFQLENQQFEYNSFFSEVVCDLPQKLNTKNKTFLAWSHTGCCYTTYRYFKFDESRSCKLIHIKETGPKE